ncbi:MAG: putative viral replication protein [Cressdnaviricota sp.]|nr:MAG: putative viral replication protein [Cressdnaviricota sp.]
MAHIEPCHICNEPFNQCRCLEDIAISAMSQSTSGSQTSEDTTLRARHWCFTLNTPSQQELSTLSTVFATSPACMYMVYQLEEGSNGTRHAQGYIEFNAAQRFSTVKRLISPRIHLEKRMGTRDQAREYCMKLESRVEGPWEYGTWVPGGSGRRSDLHFIREKIKQGATEVDLWEEYFPTMARNYRAIDRYRGLVSVPRDTPPVVHVLYGPTGTGKSRWCQETFPGAYWKSQDQWWDDYDGQEAVICDEFYGWLKFSILLRICDRYPIRLERKGGFINFKTKTIVFCSNTKPEEWYQNIKNFNAFERRVDLWHYLPEEGKHDTVTSVLSFKRLIEV